MSDFRSALRALRRDPGVAWLINFYRVVGSFKVTWIAQASEDSGWDQNAPRDRKE